MDTKTAQILIPARRQALWGWPAVANFALGGLGAGWYAVAALAAGLEPSPATVVASSTAPVLVLAGLAAVAGEAGRPLRGLRVLARPRTSWMSRELLLALAFVLLVAADAVAPHRGTRLLAVVAALLLVLAHGFVVRRARAIPAWNVGIMPALFVLSALVSGAGAHLIVEAVAGRAPRPAGIGTMLIVLAMAQIGWHRYLTWTPDEAHRRAVAPLRDGLSGVGIDGAGHAAPLVLGLLALALPAAAGPLLVLAGALLVAGQVFAKARLILVAGALRPITLAIALPGRRPS